MRLLFGSEEIASDKTYYRNRFANPVIEHGRKAASSYKTYYRKQVLLPVVECGAKDAPFIGSEEIASDKTYSKLFVSKRQSIRRVLSDAFHPAQTEAILARIAWETAVNS